MIKKELDQYQKKIERKQLTILCDACGSNMPIGLTSKITSGKTLCVYCLRDYKLILPATFTIEEKP